MRNALTLEKDGEAKRLIAANKTPSDPRCLDIQPLSSSVIQPLGGRNPTAPFTPPETRVYKVLSLIAALFCISICACRHSAALPEPPPPPRCQTLLGRAGTFLKGQYTPHSSLHTPLASHYTTSTLCSFVCLFTYLLQRRIPLTAKSTPFTL